MIKSIKKFYDNGNYILTKADATNSLVECFDKDNNKLGEVKDYYTVFTLFNKQRCLCVYCLLIYLFYYT